MPVKRRTTKLSGDNKDEKYIIYRKNNIIHLEQRVF